MDKLLELIKLYESELEGMYRMKKYHEEKNASNQNIADIRMIEFYDGRIVAMQWCLKKCYEIVGGRK